MDGPPATRCPWPRNTGVAEQRVVGMEVRVAGSHK